MGKKDTEKALADETDILVNRIIEQGIDCVIGGFPCQDISGANRHGDGGSGIAGSRSGLFWEMVKTICVVRPKFWIMENVAALFNAERQESMGAILSAVASSGYDCEWDCVGAGTVGAPHFRARAYFLAYPHSNRIKRHFPQKIQRQPEFSGFEDIRSIADLRERPKLFAPFLCRSYPGLAKRLHGIGNGNPPCVIREIMKHIIEQSTKG